MSWEGRQISTKAQYSEQRRQLGRFLLSVPGEAHLDAEQGKHLTLCSLYSICACICAICLNTLYYQRRETDVSRTWLISSQFSKNRTRWFMTWTLPFPLEQGAQAASLDQVSQLGTFPTLCYKIVFSSTKFVEKIELWVPWLVPQAKVPGLNVCNAHFK